SNSFFTRRRKKEVGLYSLLGLQKKQIAKMLFYENLFMGCVSLVISIIIGSALLPFFIKLLSKLMELNISIPFEVPIKAVEITVLVFFVIILFTSFQGYKLIYRFQLIDLFQAERKGETIPKTNFFFALVAILLIGSGYYIAANYLDI